MKKYIDKICLLLDKYDIKYIIDNNIIYFSNVIIFMCNKKSGYLYKKIDKSKNKYNVVIVFGELLKKQCMYDEFYDFNSFDKLINKIKRIINNNL